MRLRQRLVHPSLVVSRGGQLPALPDPVDRSQVQAEEGLARSLYLSTHADRSSGVLATAVGRLRWLKDVWSELDDATALLLLLRAAFEQHLLPVQLYERGLRMYACRAAFGVAFEEVVQVMRAVAYGGRDLQYEWFDVRFRSGCWLAMSRSAGSDRFDQVRCEVSHALTAPKALDAATGVTGMLVNAAVSCWLANGGPVSLPVCDGFVVDADALREQVNLRLTGMLRFALGNPFTDNRPPDPVEH